MNEVEKMYRNAHIYPRVYGDITKETFENKVFNMSDMCKEAFTAEKQLELIKFLYIKYKKYEMFKVSNRDEVGIRTSENTFYAYGIDIQNAIANFFNRNWQDLTDAERIQIKEILE